MIPLLVSSGEPAGVGPDLCVSLAQYEYPLVVLGDLKVLQQRARVLGKRVHFIEYLPGEQLGVKAGSLAVLHQSCAEPVVAGQLNKNNAMYVMKLLERAATWCGQGFFSGLVTAPVHKAIINQAGFSFTGHTEFLAEFYHVPRVVMMLACESMKVALATTHLPLKKVPEIITIPLIVEVISQLNFSLIKDFKIKCPKIKVAGLNPHAGESGYLGREEIDIISPALLQLQKQGIDVDGPLPADTLFIKEQMRLCDAFVTMYHDQGLPIIKHIGFSEAVNITLGLPIIRTSVDHGTALELAGKGAADLGSMVAAVKMALLMVENRRR